MSNQHNPQLANDYVFIIGFNSEVVVNDDVPDTMETMHKNQCNKHK